MIPYDPQGLVDASSRVYSEARAITLEYALGFGLLGGVIGGTAEYGLLTIMHPGGLAPFPWNGIIIGAVVGAVLMARLGRRQSRRMEMDAHMALCWANVADSAQRIERQLELCKARLDAVAAAAEPRPSEPASAPAAAPTPPAPAATTPAEAKPGA